MNRIRKSSVDEIVRCFEPIVGKRPWRARLGWGSFLTFEFGLPKKKVQGHWHGVWHLWIYMCDWDLAVNRHALNSEDSRTKIDRFVRVLEQKPLTGIKVDGPVTSFQFGGHTTLRCQPMADGDLDSDSPYWMLFMPDEKVLEYVPGVRVKIGPSGELAPAHSAAVSS